MMKYSGCSEDIYESMLGIDPECAEDLCKIYYDWINDLENDGGTKLVFNLLLLISPPPQDEVMSAVDENPEEAMLRKFFQGKYLTTF